MFRHLSETQILLWADAYREATGRWPTRKSGHVAGTICETWGGVDRALRLGQLTLPGGSSLAQLLAAHHGKRNRKFPSPLTLENVRAWAEPHRQATGLWPSKDSGRITAAPGEPWMGVDWVLPEGRRSLTGGSSLSRFLSQEPPSTSRDCFRVESQ
jgi:hypothetical protein